MKRKAGRGTNFKNIDRYIDRQDKYLGRRKNEELGKGRLGKKRSGVKKQRESQCAVSGNTNTENE